MRRCHVVTGRPRGQLPQSSHPPFVRAAEAAATEAPVLRSSSGADCGTRTASVTSSSRIALSTLTTSRPPPTVSGIGADAVRCARHELGQLELRDLSELLEFIADDTRKATADDFAQTVTVHKSVKASCYCCRDCRRPARHQAGRYHLRRGDPQDLLRRRRPADHLPRESQQDPGCWRYFHCPLSCYPFLHC